MSHVAAKESFAAPRLVLRAQTESTAFSRGYGLTPLRGSYRMRFARLKRKGMSLDLCRAKPRQSPCIQFITISWERDV
jgi:hypothetical protein